MKRDVETILNALIVECERHAPRLREIATMWVEVKSWIADQADNLEKDVSELTRGDVWNDRARDRFREQANKGINSIKSWSSRGAHGTFGGKVTTSGVVDRLDELAGYLEEIYPVVYTYNTNRNAAILRGITQNELAFSDSAALERLNPIVDKAEAKYRTAIDAVKAATGDPWAGPTAAIPKENPHSGTGPYPGGPNNVSPTGGGPGSTTPNPNPGTPTPDPQDVVPANNNPSNTTTTGTDSTSSLLSSLASLADSASQLLSSGGSGSGVTNPVSLPDIPNVTPVDYADYTAPETSYGSGSPSLAGLDTGGLGAGGGGPVGGGGVGAGGGLPAVSPVGNSLPVNGFSVPLAAASSGTAGSTGPSGMSPPMYPPQTGASRNGGGIKPGAAEHPANTGRQRGRKSDGTPGVALRGRTARGRSERSAPTSPRPWDTENDGLQMLDDELWQVGQHDERPEHRGMAR
ncbi:hypothetical protein [Actinocrispum wychmicini]|uniref:Uncharacterized protein n=1 Tax=Actinocrispum wychmicini TaxID=1213861 RepID=A0A4V2S664_9PSEU|nr:hypothetical protein [Actinocrispum wychmicini]TCO54790.1 hypothetical protein EV192_10878 [Actinocrispum wychmicini]